MKSFLFAFFALGHSICAFANACPNENFQDTLPSLNPDYTGFRLDLTDIKVEKKDNWVFIQFTAINTGREDILLGKNSFYPQLVLNMDQLPESYKNSFTKAFLESELKVKAGEILFDRELKIKAESALSTAVEKEVLTAEIGTINLNDNSKTAVSQQTLSESIEDDENCADLIIESISIVKKSKNSVTLKYKIKNQGKKPVSIIGATKREEDNLAMKIHMSSSEKLTRGSILIGGTFLKDGKQLPDGKLYPGKSLTDEVKVDISTMTRFTPIIIFEIDPYLSVNECNETNNQNHIKVKSK